MICSSWAYGLLAAVGIAAHGFGQTFDVRQTLDGIHNKYGAMKEYSFAAEMLVEVQKGSDAGRILARAKVVYSAGAGGRYRLEVDGAADDGAVLVDEEHARNGADAVRVCRISESRRSRASGHPVFLPRRAGRGVTARSAEVRGRVTMKLPNGDRAIVDLRKLERLLLECRASVRLRQRWAPDVFEVELSGVDGRAYAMAAVRADQLMRLHHEPIAA